MLLVMDVGNSHTVMGLYEGDDLRAHWRVRTGNYHTADEFRVLLGLLFQQEGLELGAVSGFCVSSVAPQLDMALERVSKTVFGVNALMVGPGIKTGIALQCDNPREVGADRIVNAVAGVEEYGVPLIILDFGTATTFDVITSKSQYVGGVIAPGIQISMDALFEKCAKLPRVDISRPAFAIGHNTVDNIRSGLTFGYADLVDGIVRRLTAEMDGEPTVVATGGMAHLIAGIAEGIHHVDPLLALKGLKAVYRRNERGSA
ncbi:MAG: type III pantothenate kinase [Nitrospiraceae bacterium]|nr:type III pantothenate kinase [Nitrospiraceae bacterium]